MQWKHKCSLEWLKERQYFLTATDIKDLLPVTPTGRKRKITREDYLKVLSRKQVQLREDDCISVGAAARGHLLEPYAVDIYNQNKNKRLSHMYHWDDLIIANTDGPYRYNLSFSPDGCDIDPRNLPSARTVFNANISPCEILEIKSYSAEKHLQRIYTSRDKLEERWQIATAMYVCSSIFTAHLCFFNPSMVKELSIAEYQRSDLQDEMDIIDGIVKDFNNFLNISKAKEQTFILTSVIDHEKQIIEELQAKQNLNPF